MTLDLDAYVDGVRAADRTSVARAITLVESSLPDHREEARALLSRLLPYAGLSHRVAVSGVPGSGKSTFLDALGTQLVAGGHRVAVLAVDPSSARTGGSILGDKTRMGRLAASPSAFIRPSPTSGRLGGVTAATRESIVVVEAAGFDVVFVETVGVGQSEMAAATMVDTFVLLMLARSGDSLQGIKRGVLELADVVAVNKADGDGALDAAAAARELAMVLHLVDRQTHGWVTPVLTCSALEGRDVDAVWRQVEAHRHHVERHGDFAARRARQDVEWMWSTIDDRLLADFRAQPAVRDQVGRLEHAVRQGSISPSAAADELLAVARAQARRSVRRSTGV